MPGDGDINYRVLTHEQLLEAQANIDAARYPRNHANLLQELARRQQPDYFDDAARQGPPDGHPNPFPSLVLDPVSLARRRRWLLRGMVTIVVVAIISSQAYRPMLLTGSPIATLVLPVLMGLIAAVTVGRFLLGAPNTRLTAGRRSSNLSVSDWLLAVVGAAIVAGVVVGLAGRQSMLLAGSLMSGHSRTTDAVVVEIKERYRRQRCRQLVTVATDSGQRAMLCAQPRWRSNIVPYGIAVGERVRLQITSNLTGEWVTNVSRMARRPQ